MTTGKHIVIALLLLAGVSGVAKSQQVKHLPELTGLLLEVVSLENHPPSYQKVSWATDRPGGTWYSRFGRIAGWQLPTGDLPVRAVNLVPSLRGDTVTLKVSVFRGVEFHDKEEAVATYNVRENDTVAIEELKRFGVEPFQIKVVRAVPTSTGLPSIINKTQSVAVISIEPVLSTLPEFALNVHNLTTRNISAINLHVLTDGKREISGLPQGKEGAPLIQAGGSTTLHLPATTRSEATPGGFTPTSPKNQMIEIASLVFDDGTYEGEAEGAATFRGFSVGREIELRRLIPILESALAAADEDAADAPARLRLQLQTLSYDVTGAEFSALSQAFPASSPQRLKVSVEAAVHMVRKGLVDELQRNQKGPSAAFRQWLTATKDRYSNWLARL